MKRIHFISFFFVLAIFTLSAIVRNTIAAENGTKEKKQCNCNFKELEKKGEWQKARESAEEIIANSPKSSEAKEAYLWLGLYHKSQYDFDKSSEFYRKAAKQFPKSWTSAEATARIGCNHYKMNNYTKALEYFKKAGAEAKDWQQKKYASAWSKWTRYPLAENEKQSIANCATESIDYYLNSKGIKYDNKKLASALTLKDGLVPLPQILKSLKKDNIEFTAIKCPIDRIDELELPIVAFVKPSHLIVITDIAKDKEKINVFDPAIGVVSYYKNELAKRWSDKILTISIPSDKQFVSLTKKELNKIFLGTCWCCPYPPPPPCSTDGAVCCGAAGSSPGGSGSSGGTGGECGSGSCSASVAGMGFPKITVYTTLLGLTVEDTPIGYITPVGEDVKVSITFNSDLPTSGLFGNSWYSNLESTIIEVSDSSVNVTRSGGRIDTFTYSGGLYNPPAGVTDKLVKNADGTFTLEFTKNHKKFHYQSTANGGKLFAIEDRNSNTLTYQYDTNNNLTSITDAVGKITHIQTDSAGRIIEVNDPLGREAIFTYDPNGNLTRVVDMAGNTFTYIYDTYHNITSLTEPKGTYTIEYEDTHNWEIWVKKITNPAGEEYLYNGENWTNGTYVTDPRGNATHYYSEWFYPYDVVTKKIEDALGNYVEYAYENRDKTEIRDKRGNVTYFDYDPNHNLISKTDPCGSVWYYTYDSSNNLISTTDPRGKITINEYDSHNNLLSITEKDPNTTARFRLKKMT